MSSLAARRKQRYRQRLRAGRMVLTVETGMFELTAALIEAGYITETEALDRRKVECGAAAVLASWAKHWLAHHR